MASKYKAEVKFHDPDDERESEFDTLEEATEWLRQERRSGRCAMWLNNERVDFEKDELVKLVFKPISLPVPRSNGPKIPTIEELQRVLRPVPTNPATIAVKSGDSVQFLDFEDRVGS